MLHPEMQDISNKPVPQDGKEIRLFCVARNEMLRLPFFLDYYRKIGVSRFFIVDNISTDGTLEYLRSQPDVHVFETAASFATAKGGATWINSLMDVYGRGQWCLVADADELLVYPDCEQVNLPKFCDRLDTEGCEAMQVILLDMYSDKPMPKLNYQAGQDLRQACPFFDGDYKFIKRLNLPGDPPAFPPQEPIGGPRSRMFFPRQHMAGGWRRLLVKLLCRAFKPLVRSGWIGQDLVPHPAPQMFKIPLIKWRDGMKLVTKHRTDPVTLSATSGALLHFKYLDDFAVKTADAVRHGQYYNGSSEYHRYALLLERNPNVTFMYAGSVRYASSEDLLRAGLMWRGVKATRQLAASNILMCLAYLLA